MTSEIVNVEQAEAWDGGEGTYWALHQARLDAAIAPHHAELMAAAALAPGERVLDIGCGSGQTSRDAARAVGPRGSVLGVDLSGPMLARAEELANDEGLGNIQFERADAQACTFQRETFDVVISRFGVMFFADPVAAFSNIASALRSGGRLALLTWQAMAANEWISAMRDALAVGRQLPEPPPGAPGPFALADTEHVRRILTPAGFTDVAFSGSEHPFNLGPDADGAHAFVAGLPAIQAMVADLGDPARARALEHLRTTIAAHETADGVIFGSAAWVVTARKP